MGTTTLFRELMTEETEFSRLYAVQQRLGATWQPGLRSAGVVIDSVDLGSATVVIECNLLNLLSGGGKPKSQFSTQKNIGVSYLFILASTPFRVMY